MSQHDAAYIAKFQGGEMSENQITYDQAKRWLEDSTPNHWHSSWHFQSILKAIAERDVLARLAEDRGRMLQDPDCQDVLNLREERDALKAEVERLDAGLTKAIQEVGAWSRKAGLAEAEAEELNEALGIAVSIQVEIQTELDKTEAELKAARPLLEAVEKAKHLDDALNNVAFAVEHFRHLAPGAKDEKTLLETALAYRAAKETK